jgi:ABC-type nitrate/sulfonate/bicarbonate transport system substrate-binding protein
MSDSRTEEVRLGYFSASAVSMLAHDTGIYRANGLSVIEEAVPSSPEQFRRLLSGEYDLVLTSPDNVLNYRLNCRNPLQQAADIRILAGVDMGMGLSVMAAPDVSSINDLRGRRIGVDVPDSGFAYALFEVLDRAGLHRHDYEVVTMGSTPRRASALAANECSATLLNAGYDLIAERAGARRLARVSDVLGPYPGTVLAARAEVVGQRSEVFQRFMAAWTSAVHATLDPANRLLVESDLARGLSAPSAIAAFAYQSVISSTEGLIPDGRVDPAGWRLLVDLRVASGGLDDNVNVGLLKTALPVVDTYRSPVPEENR